MEVSIEFPTEKHLWKGIKRFILWLKDTGEPRVMDKMCCELMMNQFNDIHNN